MAQEGVVSVFTMTKSMPPAPKIQRETTLNFTVNGYLISNN
jgi:hypothetical protein